MTFDFHTPDGAIPAPVTVALGFLGSDDGDLANKTQCDARDKAHEVVARYLSAYLDFLRGSGHKE